MAMVGENRPPCLRHGMMFVASDIRGLSPPTTDPAPFGRLSLRDRKSESGFVPWD